MSEPDSARLRARVERALALARRLVNQATAEGLDVAVTELADIETLVDSRDEDIVWRVRVALGSLYAQRWLHGGWAASDKTAGIRLLRAARAVGRLNADKDFTAVLQLATMLLPNDAARVRTGTLAALNAALIVGQTVMNGGQTIVDLHEVRDLLLEASAARPDDPRTEKLKEFADTLSAILEFVRLMTSGAGVTTPQIRELLSPLIDNPDNPAGALIGSNLPLMQALPHDEIRPRGAPGNQTETMPDEVAVLLETSVPGLITGDELSTAIERLERASGSDDSVRGIAALGRFAHAARTNDPREVDDALRTLRTALQDPVVAANQSWIKHTVYPAVLTAVSAAHGSRRDEAEVTRYLQESWTTPFEGSTSRFLTGSLPESAPAGRRIGLIVQITLTKASGTSALLRSLDVPPEGRPVTITVTAPDLLPLGDLEQDLYVPAATDSEPIRFGFRTVRSGLHPVTVRAFAGGTCVGEVTLQISVEVGGAWEEGPPRSTPLAGLAAEPGEVTLQVSRTEEDRYTFQLIGEAFHPVEPTRRLAGDPTKVVGALTEELRAMAGQESPYGTPALTRRRIKSLGASLWTDVVPESIRRQFWDQADRIKLFTVVSDMDTIPWELLYPIDGDNDNGFLVNQFPVVRRAFGQGRVRHLPLSSAAYVVPPGSPANAMDEIEAVKARLGDDVHHHEICSRLDILLDLIDATPSVLHFTCHNRFTDEKGSVISLDGGPLRPSDLVPAMQKRSMADASPLVFLNACRTAGESPGLLRNSGWASAFMAAGAGAFIGSLWAVRSDSAKAFADTFYRALVTEGAALGEASLRARQAIAADEEDPTWLAYTIYGNPAATVR